MIVENFDRYAKMYVVNNLISMDYRRSNCPKVFFALMLPLCSLTISCSVGKQKPMDQLEELAENIREHHEEFSLADWKEAYARYERIAADMENYQYTEEEAEMIGRLEGECVGYFMKSAINSLGGIESEIKGFVDGINNTIDQ